MKIEKEKMVSVVYELKRNDANGEVVEQLNEDKPLTFIFGSGQLLPDFEANIVNLEIGSKFEFQLKHDQAYGAVSENAIVEIPKSIFEVDGKLREDLIKVGNMVPMQDNSGQRMDGKVLEISDTIVRMDFNHPLAGENLFFSGKVTEVRQATKEELSGVQADSSCSSCSGCETETDGCGC